MSSSSRRNGSFSLSRNFIPSCVFVSGSKVLVTWATELLSVMLTKQRALSETRRQVDAAAVEFTSQDITRFLLLNALTTHIPVMRHVVENQLASPLELYLTPWGFLKGAAENNATASRGKADGRAYTVLTWSPKVTAPSGNWPVVPTTSG